MAELTRALLSKRLIVGSNPTGGRLFLRIVQHHTHLGWRESITPIQALRELPGIRSGCCNPSAWGGGEILRSRLAHLVRKE